MEAQPTQPDDLKLLPPGDADSATVASSPTAIVPGISPGRQVYELPRDELDHLGEAYGLEVKTYRDRPALVRAIHERRQLIASLDREVLLDVIRWGRRPVPVNATSEQLAQEIVRIRSMRFAGLSQRGLVALAKLRGVAITDDQDVPTLIRALKKQEGAFARIGRKRRALLGSVVSRMIGEAPSSGSYEFLPTQIDPATASAAAGPAPPPQQPSIKEEIEESGFFGGITSRIKKTADTYVNQKLDEIEARIDRKLDEIDRRLAEWRDKEIANRLRILKITLWASVIVGTFSLIYSYVKVYFFPGH